MLAELIQRDSPDQQEPLLRLYWNRAGVKRELVTLKREHHELLEKLEEQEGAILRAQNQLEGLERLLTDPLAAANAMVYFQLRHMWRAGALKIQQFAGELRQQRENRERQQLHNTILAKRSRRMEAIRIKLKELLQKRKHAIEECLRLEKRLERMNFVVRLLSGRRLKSRIQALGQNRAALDERIEEFNEVIEKIQGEPLPEPEGLSLESRRLVNLAVIALAQHLVVHFCEHDLARLSRKAAKRTVGDMKFGDRKVCDQMVERIRERVSELNADRQLADHVKRRADHLVNEVEYRHESDAIPRYSLLSEIRVSVARENGSQAQQPPLRVNVLEDDFWDLNQVLS